MSTELALRACLKLKKIFSRSRTNIFLAAMPKSASTFLHRALVRVTGFENVYFASAYRNIEQELYVPRIIDNYNVDSVTQQHPRANQVNLEIMSLYGIRPVVLIRNIHDVIVSMRDHLIRERLDNLPGLYVPTDFRDSTEEVQFDFLVTYAGPWLVSFYASWMKAREAGELDMLWLNYADAASDWNSTISKVLEFYRIARNDSEIEAALAELGTTDKAKLRMNQGVAGRGEQELSLPQQQRIGLMAKAYADIDFSPAGISV
jgi:hypothetical protein